MECLWHLFAGLKRIMSGDLTRMLNRDLVMLRLVVLLLLWRRGRVWMLPVWWNAERRIRNSKEWTLANNLWMGRRGLTV